MTDVEAIHLSRDLLESQTTMVLATADASGKPFAAPLFFWSDNALNLYWYSSPRSQHSRNLRERRAAEVTVYAPVRNWRKIRGVQMAGECTPYTDSGLVYEYRHKFRLAASMQPVILKSKSYVFRPHWLRYLDNSYGFGFQKEVSIITRARR